MSAGLWSPKKPGPTGPLLLTPDVPIQILRSDGPTSTKPYCKKAGEVLAVSQVRRKELLLSSSPLINNNLGTVEVCSVSDLDQSLAPGAPLQFAQWALGPSAISPPV